MSGKRHVRTHYKVNRKRKRVSVFVFAEILKKRMTPAEKLLWKHLQIAQKEWGVVFESQSVVAGRFIADFACISKRLLIECDGSVHQNPRVIAKDKYRTMILTRLGYTIVRFDNREVLTNCRKVIQSIRNVVFT